MTFPFYCMIAMAVSTAAPNQTISTSINKSIQEDLVNFSNSVSNAFGKIFPRC